MIAGCRNQQTIGGADRLNQFAAIALLVFGAAIMGQLGKVGPAKHLHLCPARPGSRRRQPQRLFGG